jgi:hypothetical protein
MNDNPLIRITIIQPQSEIIIIESQSTTIVDDVMRKYGTDRSPVIHVDNIEEIKMGDTYHLTGQAGAVGPNARSDHNTFVQSGTEPSPELAVLAEQLEIVRLAMKARLSAGSTAEQDEQVGQIAKAQIAAKKGDNAGMMAHLKDAGSWAIVVAREAGAEIIAKLIANLIGFHG